MTREDRENAYLYCKFRDEQFALCDGYAKSCGILMKTFLVLNVLFYAKDGVTQREICDKTFQSKQTVSLIVKSLLQKGRAALSENPEDRRNKIVRLTDAGRAFAEKPVRHITNAENAAMAMLTPGEQAQLIALSRQFTKNLTEFVKGEEVSVLIMPGCASPDAETPAQVRASAENKATGTNGDAGKETL